MSGRYEYKYRIDAARQTLLAAKAEGLMLPDEHADATGVYVVRSLYLEDVFDSCLQDNLRGADPRSKFRVRRYGDDLSYLVLEKKSKHGGMSKKISCRLTVEECRAILAGEIPPAAPDMAPVKQRLLTEARMRALGPKNIVTYTRRPFVYPAGSVRVTFDSDLTASRETERFLAPDYFRRPVLPPGEAVMEVKWTGVMPAHIRGALQDDHLVWTAFSKYTICRLIDR